MVFRLRVIPSLLDAYFRRSFSSAGLRPCTVPIDSETTIHCWIPHSLNADKNSNKVTRSEKPLVVLVHGFGPPATWQWRNQVVELSRHFDVIMPDLIFFGGSTTKSAERSEVFQARSLVSLLDKLHVDETKKVFLVGTSYGGFVVYHMARLMGAERAGKVVIASSDLLKMEEDDKAFMERARVENISDVMIPTKPEMMRILMKLAFYRPPRFVPDFALRDFIQNIYRVNIKEKMELINGVTLGNKEEFQLTPIPQEVLIIWGEHDKLFPLNKAHEIRKCLGEGVKLEIMKNTGHLPQYENPPHFNDVLVNFLSHNSESGECI